MVETKSNMPEMDWRPAVDGGWIAYPNGFEHQDQYLIINNEDEKRPVDGMRFDWFIRWEGRFFGMHGSITLEEAKRECGQAWWLAIEKTEGWKPGDPSVKLFKRYDPYGSVDWRRGQQQHEEFLAKMRLLHEERLAERAAARKLARDTEKGRLGMIGPPDPRKGRIWKPKA